MHSYDHDAYFCPVCDKWLDSACSDPECRFCKNRPKFPLMSGKETNKLNDLINNKIMKRKERARKKFERKYNKG
ncbi:MAG: hypothetical protein GY714_05440 [Desulfobacterales bacterium]|nr:hypothetical protein [Desulfobacterales bacterium]